MTILQRLDILRKYVNDEWSRGYKIRPFNFTRFSISELRRHFQSRNLKWQPVFFFSHWVIHYTKAMTDYTHKCTYPTIQSSLWRQRKQRVTIFGDDGVAGYQYFYDLYQYDKNSATTDEEMCEYVLTEYRLTHDEYDVEGTARYLLPSAPTGLGFVHAVGSKEAY